ncbi:MAG: HEAT repeat domain-containing protein, partial [Treponema sp.]|nr:HEAT repeat domain-containing protein [Treponema sp.]
AVVLKGKASLQTLEDMLLEILEYGDGQKKVRACTIAKYFSFPEKSLVMIKERLTGNIATGCRKAGLYRYEDAVGDILKALHIFSSEVQLQALMALARIGDAAAMVQAFDKIHRLILINERAVYEVLNTFTGDRYELYKRMIHHQSDYLIHLFLKAIDEDIASRLIDDIIAVTKNGGMELLLTQLVAIGKSGDHKKIPLLVKALQDKNWEIRAMAAKTLGVLTGPEAIKPLVAAARDGEWWVRQNAVTSILAYPDCDKILAVIAKSGDKYAFDSMLYAIGKADRPELLAKINEAWPAKPKRADIKHTMVSG